MSGKSWIKHFEQMAERVDGGDHKKFYILKKGCPKQSTPPLPPVISRVEASVDRAKEEIKRRKKGTKQKRRYDQLGSI